MRSPTRRERKMMMPSGDGLDVWKWFRSGGGGRPREPTGARELRNHGGERYGDFVRKSFWGGPAKSRLADPKRWADEIIDTPRPQLLISSDTPSPPHLVRHTITSSFCLTHQRKYVRLCGDGLDRAGDHRGE
ncbi:uncharacterized protein PGTG_02350 [Puccinia graminis f. sp. tritici CRL 75-36-700-3]|uniref:Uncharacterized protein n=1 Tax=Puccinia graminis f. sp. tritici (strain CRL 75-36-700-3 / race SCCL) TaxID=418459 RepID=E3JXW4_PUCGT|nr:uncharacterized protein PGTG_02350 [Puccinia graminis f. sp. tritici CRL 75-36-700-3]EFP76889.1 hypothetical protein PGTG_02350 [Puccinia graminis f. sp. tritici CRL 75-36-700-3]